MSDPAELAHRIALERNDAARKVLGDILAEIDGMSEKSNELYRKAYKKVAIVVKAEMTRDKF